MIQAIGLSKSFGRITAVDSVDFQITPGQVVAFLGPNGAGKSTTIRMICGYLPPTRGTVRVDGFDVRTHSRAVRRRLGYLPESAPLYTEMRVSEYLQFRARLFGIPRAKRRSAIDLALRRCWLTDVQRRPIAHLSKGYRQRVGLAAAMLHEPPVLILDEPTVGLDPAQIREVRGLIRELAGQHTILLSTHILPEVELTCDRVLIIARGRIRAQGTVEELRTRAQSDTRYVIETSDKAAIDAIKAVPGVAHVDAVTIDGEWLRLTVTADDGAEDLRRPLVRAMHTVQARVREIRRDALSLEHMFMRIVAEAESDYAGSARSAAASPRRGDRS